MVHKILFLITLLLPQYTHGNYLFETSTEFHLKNEHLEIHVSKKTGNVAAIIINNKNILSQEGTVDINIHSKTSEEKIVKIECKDNYPKSAKIYFKKECTHVSLNYQFIIDSLAFRWEIEVLSTIDTTQETNLTFKIPIIKSMSHLFYPTKDTVLLLDEISRSVCIYRRNLFIPMVCVYNSHEDYGLSIISPFEILKPKLMFSTDKERLDVVFDHLRLAENKKCNAAIYIVPHEGDWRPGLAFLLNKYPDYFYPKVENTKVGEGWYSQGRPSDKRRKIEKAAQRAVGWIEFHYYFPFLGLYVPKLENWGLIANSDEISLSEWEKGAGKIRNCYKNMEKLINVWHEYGIQVYLYFQSFEAWHQYAEKYFSRDIARNKRNKPHSAWKLCNLMNPDPTSKWGEYIIDQAKKLVKKYPRVDGIFYDRMDYWKYDFAHDDGITMIENKPAYMLHFGLEKINEKIFDIFHRNKKGIWGNGPRSIDVCKNLDGILVEINPSLLYKIQYLGLVRPIVFLTKDRTSEDTENKLKNALLCGAFPSTTSGDLECQRLDEKYRPLFDLIKNREWVLSSNPLELPIGLNGNLFLRPDGDYVVTIIDHEKSQLIPHPFKYNIPIKINIPNADKINFTYLLSGDWQGINSIDFKKENNTIVINLPYHLSSSLIYLTKKKQCEIVRLSSPILIRGTDENLIFRIDNIGGENLPTIDVETPWLKKTTVITGNHVTIQTTVPKDIIGEVDLTVNYNGRTYHFTSWILEPISVAPVEDIFIKNTAGDRVQLYFVNNLERTVSFNTQGKFVYKEGSVMLPNRIYMQARETKTIDALIASETDGTIQIITTLDTEEIQNFYPVKTSLSFSKEDLFHDNFSQGMINWTIDRGKWIVSNNTAIGSGSSHFAFIKNNNWQDYVFEVKTRCNGSDNPSVDWLKAYIFFRVQDEKNFYRFGIHGGYEMISLYKYENDKWFELAKMPFSAQRERWYVLKVVVKGNKITGYLNGEIVIEATDNTFPLGGIGIGVLEDWMVTEYKDVIVKKY